jgi:hypothetical protein
MALSKTVNMGDTRSMEIRATINNVFNTVQYSGGDNSELAAVWGSDFGSRSMRSFQFTARFRF